MDMTCPNLGEDKGGSGRKAGKGNVGWSLLPAFQELYSRHDVRHEIVRSLLLGGEMIIFLQTRRTMPHSGHSTPTRASESNRIESARI
jgi:hypothetical protein